MVMWGNGKKVAVCFSFDFDAETLWFGGFKMDMPSQISRGEYGARVGVPRVLKLLEKYNIPATFFVPAWTAEHHRDECKEIVQGGHEVAFHSHHHENVVGMRMELERDLMLRSMDVLEQVSGQRPRGNRATADLSNNSPYLLQELGFVYDSSSVGADEPYWMPMDGKDSNIVELPAAWELDDAPYFIFSYSPYMSGLWGPDHVYDIWKQEFDGAYQDQGLFLVTMHPQFIGRRPRMAMLEQLIQYINQHDDVWWARHIDAAEDWRDRQLR